MIITHKPHPHVKTDLQTYMENLIAALVGQILGASVIVIFGVYCGVDASHISALRWAEERVVVVIDNSLGGVKHRALNSLGLARATCAPHSAAVALRVVRRFYFRTELEMRVKVPNFVGDSRRRAMHR